MSQQLVLGREPGATWREPACLQLAAAVMDVHITNDWWKKRVRERTLVLGQRIPVGLTRHL